MVINLRVIVASVVLGAAGTVCGQDLVADGPGLQVNNSTSRFDRHPAVTIDPSGGFVVVWESFAPNKDVYGRRFGSSGEPLGNEFRINRTTFGAQSAPSVCGDATGGFVVVWQSSRQDGDGNGIYGQRFSPAGKRIGSEFRVNTNPAGDQRYPSIACDDQGNFVVVYTNDLTRVRAQRFRSTGARVGRELSISRKRSPFLGGTPSVCSTPTGAFIVAWSDSDPVAQTLFLGAQRFDRLGNRVGPATVLTSQFEVVADGLSPLSISCNASGQFAVAWYSQALRVISAAIVDATGQKLADIVLQKDSSFANPVAIDAAGNTLLTWNEFVSGDQFHVHGQFFAPDGSLLGSELQLDDLNDAVEPEIALSPEGRLVGVWTGATQADGVAIFARLFQVDGL